MRASSTCCEITSTSCAKGCGSTRKSRLSDAHETRRTARLRRPLHCEISIRPMSALGRYCCKSPKLPGDNFPAVRRSDRRPPIYVVSITLPRSPVSLSSSDEVSHIFTRKSRLQPGEFLITSAKRLLQHNRTQSGHWLGHGSPGITRRPSQPDSADGARVRNSSGVLAANQEDARLSARPPSRLWAFRRPIAHPLDLPKQRCASCRGMPV